MEDKNIVKERLRASYNAIAPKYNDWTERHHELRRSYLDRLFTHCTKLSDNDDQSKKQILELGCGSANPFLTTLLQRAPSVYIHANDLSEVQLDIARCNLAAFRSQVEFHLGDMMKLEFEPGSLTAVVALYSIIHLPQDEQKEMISRISDWLVPGGVFLATFTSEEAHSIVNENWIDEKGWIFWSSLGQDKLIRILTEDARLDIEHVALEGDEDERFLWIIAKKPNI
jgi:ubiquinone/menaquinone biosynthesis C-methylase UbiE